MRLQNVLPKIKTLILLIIFFSHHLFSDINSVFYKSRFAPDNFDFPKSLSLLKNTFYDSIKVLDEKTLISTSLQLGGTQLGLKAEQVQSLVHAINSTYDDMANDSSFKEIQGVLNYCIQNPDHQGHYFLYTPKHPNEQTILFIHGYGGNPLFYLYLLKKHFPRHHIICPTSGVSWEKNSNDYLEEILSHADNGTTFTKQVDLIALSQGGPAGFRFLESHPTRVRKYIPIVTSPTKYQINTVPPKSNIFMINGKKDSGFDFNWIQYVYKKFSQNNSITFNHHVFDDDHFILLTRENEVFRLLRKFILF